MIDHRTMLENLDTVDKNGESRKSVDHGQLVVPDFIRNLFFLGTALLPEPPGHKNEAQEINRSFWVWI